jgi:hypothetical protein
MTRARITCDADTRAVTPPPDQTAGPSRPPLAPDAFANLSLAEQLHEIRPHLDSVIRDEYAPGRWRADKFFGTPSERAALIRKVQLGDIHPDHSAEIIVPELRRWALRGFTLLTTIPDIHADVLTRLNSNVPRSRLVLPDPVDTNRSVQTPESVSSWTCFSPKL